MGTPNGRFEFSAVRNNINLEKVRQELLKDLSLNESQKLRNCLGQFATPFKLASEIVYQAISMLPLESNICFLEPGFGTGPFYSALINSPFAFRVQVAKGIEIDLRYGEAARKIWQNTGLQLTIGDFTKIIPPKNEEDKFNLVICNPPYIRHQHLTQVQKQELQSAVSHLTGLKINGLTGLYVYFMILSQAWMSQNGVGAWLIPSEFMDVNYGEMVKRFLLERVTLELIYRSNPQEVQFENALVSSAIVFFRNALPPKKHKVKFTFGGCLSNPELSKEIEVDHLRESPKWTHFPERDYKPSLRNSSYKLGDFFTIKRGLATGCNSFFILTQEQIAENQLPKEFLIPVLPSPKALETNEVMSDQNGIPKIKNKLYLLSCDIPEEQVRTQYPMLWRYLRRGEAERVNERYLCKHRRPWYSQEIRPPAPLLCTYMGRSTKRSKNPFRFILNHSKATATNVYLMLYPNPPLDLIIKNNKHKVWEILSLIKAEILTGEGRVYGGGLNKIEPKELCNIPAAALHKLLHNKFQP